MGLISRVSSRTYRPCFLKMAEKTKCFRAKNIRGSTPAELQTKLDGFRQELANLRVASLTQSGAGKLGIIRETRKNIAKVLTVMNQSQKEQPVDLKPRKTRAMRKALNKHEESLKNLKTI